ncbi:HigA family addiction module antitoxin [Trinickia sp.]|uniref:HigA family addiction module antitoxin n=1 Tax=Trinickia sp. TaxID=2571163 RepID=UPI003F7DCA2E
MARFQNKMRPVHPGEILREEYLVPLGMTANALATALHVTPARINDIVRERRGITPDTALRLARYFGGDAQTWLNLQQAFDLKTAAAAHGKDIDREVTPRKLAA